MFKVYYDDIKKRYKRKSKQRKNEEFSTALAEKLFNGAPRRAEALVEIHYFDFLLLIFLYFSQIFYH
jgi:hypothetical protein